MALHYEEIPTLDRTLYNELTLQSEDKSPTLNMRRRRNKAEFNAHLERKKTVICEDFWDRFILLSRVVYMHDKEADLYDVFETMRTKVLGGWVMDGAQLHRANERVEGRHGLGEAGI